MARRSRSASKSKSPKSRRSTRKSRKSGSKKKVNAWVKHVVAQSKKLNISLKQALQDSRVRASYKKAKKQ